MMSIWGKRNSRKAYKLLDENNVKYTTVSEGGEWLNRKEYHFLELWLWLDLDKNEDKNIYEQLKLLRQQIEIMKLDRKHRKLTDEEVDELRKRYKKFREETNSDGFIEISLDGIKDLKQQIMCQHLKDSLYCARSSEQELWEYLIAHDEVEDFNQWVIEYRKSQEQTT